MKRFLMTMGALSLSACTIEFDPTLTNAALERRIQQQVREDQQAFDWNEASDQMLCNAFGQNEGVITVGTKDYNANNISTAALRQLEQEIIEITGSEEAIQGRDPLLGALKVAAADCEELIAIRELDSVGFVEPGFALSTPSVEASLGGVDLTFDISQRQTAGDLGITPGTYEPELMEISYADYIDLIDPSAADRIRRHNLDAVYEQYGHFGSPDIGVAVLDNGVLAEDIAYLSTGQGDYSAEGFYDPFLLDTNGNDGIHPQFYDIFGIASLIPNIFNHGSRQSMHVFNIAPHTTRKTVRASSFVLLFLPSQYEGVAKSIIAMADDPTIRVASMSMGTILRSNEIERAIEYFNSKDKLFVSAAGTFLPVVKDAIGVVFPANLPSTISTTGLQDTGGEGLVLGRESHGGPENDFVVDHSDSSSETVSTTAGMIGLLWSINPQLSRTEIFDIMVQSSNFYQEQGEKHPVFGWGKVDMLQAVEKVRATL